MIGTLQLSFIIMDNICSLLLSIRVKINSGNKAYPVMADLSPSFSMKTQTIMTPTMS
jgi:hypothetical protein